MNESVYDSIACSAEYLGLEVSATELAALANEARCIWRNPVATFAAISGHGAERVAGFFEL